METKHLNVIRDADGLYHIEVVHGADRIILSTLGLASESEAAQALSLVRAGTGLPVGRTV